jgi:hypothetical protein
MEVVFRGRQNRGHNVILGRFCDREHPLRGATIRTVCDPVLAAAVVVAGGHDIVVVTALHLGVTQRPFGPAHPKDQRMFVQGGLTRYS